MTKYVGTAEIRALVEAGCTVLAESRPQALWSRAEELSGLGIRWHLVGTLQRNKVRRTLPLVELVHSADSPQLVETIDRVAAELGRRAAVLLEVNVSGDEAKHGFPPGAIAPMLPSFAEFRHVEVRGLMCMAGLEADSDETRRQFALLRKLRDRLRGECPPGVRLDELSMGMSGDFEAAIAEGATMVRIGSLLFEGVLP